jgi:beta-galactosidase
VAEGVRHYVENGGTAVAEARLAWNDERGFSSDVVPGFGLAEVFGGREKTIRPVEKASLIIEPSAVLPGLELGQPVAAEAFEESLEPLENARVLARFASGEPAMVEKQTGKGKAILVGSFPALAFERHHETSTGRLFLALAHAAGVAPQVEVTGAPELEVRRLVGERFEFLFAFNHSSAPAEAGLSVRLPWPLEAARNLADGNTVPFRETGENAVFEKNLSGGEIWVLRLERR